MKKIIYIILILLILIPPVSSAYEDTEDIIRLHIPANSNSPYDQAIKQSVKEYFLNGHKNVLKEFENNKETLNYIKENKKIIENDINAFLTDINAPYLCKVTIQNEFHKGNRLMLPNLPEGIYPTVRILLGDASGKNVFFVMYPSLGIKEGVTVSFDNNKGIRYKSKLFEIIKKEIKKNSGTPKTRYLSN